VHLRARPIFSVVTSFAPSSRRMCFFIPVSDTPERFGELADRRAARRLRAGFRRVDVGWTPPQNSQTRSARAVAGVARSLTFGAVDVSWTSPRRHVFHSDNESSAEQARR
jgi:hypothetical protein